MSAAEHFRDVYSRGVEDYQRLVECEDAAGLLWEHLAGLVDWSECDVVELGAGTGRLSVWLAPRARSLQCFDQSPEMLSVARRRLDAIGATEVTLTVAEHRRLPLDDHAADVLVEGWAVAHYVDWEPVDWANALDAAVTEMDRVVRPGGMLILVETLGTGVAEPAPPTPALADLYQRLETTHGFVRAWVRTDYAFADAATARDVVDRFFGSGMVAALDGAVLPECTGVWCRRVGGTG